MLFPTFDFLLFIVPVLITAWALRGYPALRTVFLLAASYFFYMGGPKEPPPTPPPYVLLLVFSTVLDFVCGKVIHRHAPDAEAGDPRAARIRKLGLIASLVGNLTLLGYFKYTNFMLSAFADILGAVGLEVMVPHLELVLPVGISFYTFQSLSYTIDVYRGRLTPEPSFRKFALFVVFFPQLVAGPIVRANEFLPQLHARPRLDATAIDEGMFRICKGLFKKVILGDFVAAAFTDRVFASPDAYTSAEILLALYAFTLQLYADFAGYSDIAIGVARLLGYQLPENFDRPYQARNLGEFWRRWHMTLSTWLRDYLFFPLGGSRGTPARTYFNLWLTMFLVGMWHGASWNFVIYSNLHAFAMLFNRWNRLRSRDVGFGRRVVPWGAGVLAVGGLCGWLSVRVLQLEPGTGVGVGIGTVVLFLVVALLPERDTPFWVGVHILFTFHFTVLSRVFFRAGDLDISRQMIAGMLEFDGLGLRPGLMTPAVWAALLFGLAYHFTPRRWIDGTLYDWFRRIPGPVLGIAFAGLCVLIMQALSQGPRSFIYFQF